MKKVLIMAGFVVLVGSTQAQTSSTALSGAQNGAGRQPQSADQLELKESAHNFGKIPQGRPAIYTFEITNTGTEELKLTNVHASCGCTTPEWSKEPIAPGGTAEIRVGYNAYAEGPFNKMVTITYGGGRTKTLTISGDVYKSPTSSAPQNASVQFLKQINQ
jgi:Protein of unknown function (DUF1573)